MSVKKKIQSLRDVVYIQSEKNKLLSAFNKKEKQNKFRVFSPELFNSNCTIGMYSYVAINTIVTDCEIGKFTSIGPNSVIGYGQHPTNFVSTSIVFYSDTQIFDDFKNEKSLFPDERKKIIIGNDVWIGANVFIKTGVTIGDGAIIAAGASIVKNVEPYAIVGGVPGKLIKLRFEESIIKKLLEIKWWNWDIEKIKKFKSYFASPDIEKFISDFKNEL